jgi:hypothetical protein
MLMVPENYGDPAMSSISDEDVRNWVGMMTWHELLDNDSRINPSLKGALSPGVYFAKCVTRCRLDDVCIDILEVTKQ